MLKLGAGGVRVGAEEMVDTGGAFRLGGIEGNDGTI